MELEVQPSRARRAIRVVLAAGAAVAGASIAIQMWAATALDGGVPGTPDATHIFRHEGRSGVSYLTARQEWITGVANEIFFGALFVLVVFGGLYYWQKGREDRVALRQLAKDDAIDISKSN